MSATATPNIETRVIESQAEPGKFCAQIFCTEVKPQQVGEGKPIRHFKELQFSPWCSTRREAIDELETKCKMEGYKKV